MIANTLFIIFYVACGILTYGIVKNNSRQFYTTLKYVGYDSYAELMCIVCGLLGYYGFFAALGTTLILRFAFHIKPKLGLCYKMPKEFLNSTRQAEFKAEMKQLNDKINQPEQETQRLTEAIKSLPPRTIGRG